MSNTEQMREAFERHMSDGGKFPKAVERSGDGYHLLQSQNAWDAWKACAAAIIAKTTTENTPKGMLSTTCPWCESGFAFEATALTAPAAEVPTDGWLQEGGLLYRLTDGRHPENRDEINVTMADGSRTPEARARRAGELLDRIRGGYPQAAAEVPEAMGDDEWIALAERHASADWNSDEPDGFLNAVKSLVNDALQSTRLRGGVPEGEQRNREADRARFPDPNFNRWLDEAITENGEYTAWHALQSTGDAYAGWCVRPGYTGPAPEGHALVPVEPTPEMIEAARNVKRQRLVRAAADIKKGKHPDTIGMALSVNEEWTAMLTAAPQAPAPELDAGVVRGEVLAELRSCAELMEEQHTWITSTAASLLIRNRIAALIAMSAQAGKGGAA